MKRLFYSILILLMIPGLLMAQGLSLKSINDNLTTNYRTTALTDAYIASQGFLTSASLSAYRLVADSYTTSEVDTLLAAKLNADVINGYYTAVTTDMFLSLKANVADVYTTAQVDLLLNAKLDASVISGYYTALQVDAKLLDYATTAAVALKIGRSDYFTDTLGGSVPPSGSTSGGTVLCDDGVFRSVASVGGGVTNAVDLNVSASTYSRIMSVTDINAQLAFNAIEENAATTAEVAAKANTADVYTKSEVNSTIENAINAIPPPDFTNYYTKAQTNSTIENAIAAATASVSVNQTVSVTAGENLTAGDVVSLINSYGTVTAKKNNLSINTSPNGSEYVFKNGTSSYCQAVVLDTTRFIVVFKNEANGYVGGIVGTVSGSSITYGNLVSAYWGTGGTYPTVAKIGTDKVLVAYSTASSVSYCEVWTITGNTITNNESVAFLDTTTTNIQLTNLETDKCLICYSASSKGYAKIITVSSTTPTPYPDAATAGTEFNAAATAYISCSALSATSAIVAYQDGGDSNYGTAQVLSISGTTITPGTEYVFNSAGTDRISVTTHTTAKAIISFRNATTAYVGKSVIATNTAGALGYGTPYSFITGGGASIDAVSSAYMGNGYFLLSYVEGTVSDGYSQLGKINNDESITFETYKKVNTYTGTSTSICYLGNQKSAIVYSDGGNSSYGTAVVNTWATTDYSAVRGIATANITSGNSAPILLSGTLSAYTGLITGADYFVQSDYSLGTLPVSLNGNYIKIGEAINATTIFCH